MQRPVQNEINKESQLKSFVYVQLLKKAAASKWTVKEVLTLNLADFEKVRAM
jgi:hypothetical protein